jgi:uncharacterized protein YcbX
MYQVSGIFIYPIKSLRGIRVHKAALCRTGFELDRRWMLVDDKNRFLSQRECSQLALFSVQIGDDSITIFNRQINTNPLSFNIHEYSGIEKKVFIWDDICDAVAVSTMADAWFSEILKRSVQLVYMPEATHRRIDPTFAIDANDTTSFSDGFPILMIGEASINELNKRLELPVGVERFRPNLLISGGLPHDEDRMKRFTINNHEFYGVKPCVRCVMTTLDPETGVGGTEPLKTLSHYRSINKGIMFGQNVIGPTRGHIHTGDSLQVKELSGSDNFVLNGK